MDNDKGPIVLQHHTNQVNAEVETTTGKEHVMPARSLGLIRRHTNRLNDLVQKWMGEKPALKAIQLKVEEAVGKVNATWQSYQQLAIKGDKERAERDSAMSVLNKWIQEWRPNVLLFIKGADENIHKIPSTGGTTDDTIRVAEDMVALMESSSEAETFRKDAIDSLGDKLESAKKENKEAIDALPAENLAREAYGMACSEANVILV